MAGTFGLNGAEPSSPGHVTVLNSEVPPTSATFPAVAARLIVPVESGAGKCEPIAPPDAS